MNWTPEEVDDAERIVNDIAERIDNRESRAALRQALAIYADKLQEALEARNTLASEQTLKKLHDCQSYLESLGDLQARYDADMALMNQRLIEQDANYLRRLQAKTQREGFVPVDAVDRLIERLTLWGGAEDSSDGSRAYENAIDLVNEFLKPNE